MMIVDDYSPCVSNPEPYDVLIDSEKNTPGRRAALRKAVELCHECPVRFKCLSVENRDEPWAQMVSLGMNGRLRSA